jgi:hypothetical protein
MRRALLRAGAIALSLVVGSAGGAAAQTVGKPGQPHIEISGGVLFVGGYSGGEKNADLTANQSGGGPYTLFKSRSRIESAPAIEARLGWRLSRIFTVEGGVFTARPQLTTRLTADVESAPDTTAAEDLSVYIIDAAVLVNFVSKPEARVVPFARAGVGYVRELHEDNALVKTGSGFHAGGGVTMWLNGRQTFGIRADARVYVIRGGIDLDGGSRTQGAGGGSVVFAF